MLETVLSGAFIAGAALWALYLWLVPGPDDDGETPDEWDR